MAEPLDILGYMRASTASGVALGQAMARNIQHGQELTLRRQELESQNELRKMQEAHYAQQMAIQLQQHNLMVDAQADRAKAAAAMQAESMLYPPVQVPVPVGEGANEGTGEGTTGPGFRTSANPQAPLPEDLYMKHMLPVDQKWSGIVPGVRGPLDSLADYARIKKEREALAKGEAIRPFSDIGRMQADRERARAAGDMAAVAEIDDAITKHKETGATSGAMERNIRFLDAQLANGQITQDQYKHAKEIALNLAPKVSAASEWMNRIEVTGLLKRREMLLEKQILEEEKVTEMEAKGIGGFTGVSKTKFEEQKRKAASWKARVDDVDKEINSFKPRDKAVDLAPPAGGGDQVLIRTPKGDIMPIPRANLPEALKHGATEYGPGKPGYEG